MFSSNFISKALAKNSNVRVKVPDRKMCDPPAGGYGTNDIARYSAK